MRKLGDIFSSDNGMINLVKGDITVLDVDAIVNAANTTLLGGGGVDGAIHRAAGRQLYDECVTLKGCDTGDAKITKGYNLKARYVIHTVGPVWYGGHRDEFELLSSCYRRCLEVAKENGVKSIAFPCISTGVYCFPKETAAMIAVTETRRYMQINKLPREVTFVVFDDESYTCYDKILHAKNDETL